MRVIVFNLFHSDFSGGILILRSLVKEECFTATRWLVSPCQPEEDTHALHTSFLNTDFSMGFFFFFCLAIKMCTWTKWGRIPSKNTLNAIYNITLFSSPLVFFLLPSRNILMTWMIFTLKNPQKPLFLIFLSKFDDFPSFKFTFLIFFSFTPSEWPLNLSQRQQLKAAYMFV